MLSQHDELARDFLRTALESGVKNPEFKVQARYEIKADQDCLPLPAFTKSFSGIGKEETAFDFLDSIGENSGVHIEIHTGLNAGDSVPSFIVLSTSDESQVDLNFEEDDDKVYLLEFWATWCGSCQKPMALSQEILEKHPEWEGRAEIIAISLDDDIDALRNAIAENGWDKVSFYWADKGCWESDIAVNFGISGIPTCMLIRNNKVIWRGHAADRNFERDIETLLAGNPFGSSLCLSNEASALAEPQKEDFEEKAAIVRARLRAFKEDLPYIETPRLVYIGMKAHKLDGEVAISTKAYLAGFISKLHSARLEALVSEVAAVFPKVNDWVRKVENYTIEREAACKICYKAFEDTDVQYLSLVEPGFALCEACEANPREGRGSARLAHPYSMYCIHPQAGKLNEVVNSVAELGKDTFYEDAPEAMQHGACCDNQPTGECEGPVFGVRWRCAHCRDYDFCDACHSKWISGPSEQSLIEAAKNLHFSWHVFIKKVYPNSS